MAWRSPSNQSPATCALVRTWVVGFEAVAVDVIPIAFSASGSIVPSGLVLRYPTGCAHADRKIAAGLRRQHAFIEAGQLSCCVMVPPGIRIVPLVVELRRRDRTAGRADDAATLGDMKLDQATEVEVDRLLVPGIARNQRRNHREHVAAAGEIQQGAALRLRQQRRQHRLRERQRLAGADGQGLRRQQRIITAKAVGERARQQRGLVGGRCRSLRNRRWRRNSSAAACRWWESPVPKSTCGVTSVKVPPPPNPCASIAAGSITIRALIWAGLTAVSWRRRSRYRRCETRVHWRTTHLAIRRPGNRRCRFRRRQIAAPLRSA